jgi:hypothetical protein
MNVLGNRFILTGFKVRKYLDFYQTECSVRKELWLMYELPSFQYSPLMSRLYERALTPRVDVVWLRISA